MGRHAQFRLSGRVQAAGLVFGLAVAAPCLHEVVACVSCAVPSDSLTPVHPKSLAIAIATRAAIDAGALPPTLSELREKKGERVPIGAQEAAAPALLKLWLGGVQFKDDEARVVHFLFVDTAERVNVVIGKGTFTLQETPSAESGATVVTTRHVLQAVAHGRVDVTRAKELGVLLVEGELPASLTVAVSTGEKAGEQKTPKPEAATGTDHTKPADETTVKKPE